MSGFHTNKDEIRRAMKAFRTSMADNDWQRRSRLITQHLVQADILRKATTVHAFWPLTAAREVDLRPAIQSWKKEGKQIVLPVVHGLRLHHAYFETEELLRPGAFGQMEPVTESAEDVSHLDAILVPALAVDKHGNRIGYGGGFYDRFLRETDALIIAPVFKDQLLDSIPSEEHDIPVDFVVTEDGMIETNTL